MQHQGVGKSKTKQTWNYTQNVTFWQVVLGKVSDLVACGLGFY